MLYNIDVLLEKKAGDAGTSSVDVFINENEKAKRKMNELKKKNPKDTYWLESHTKEIPERFSRYR